MSPGPLDLVGHGQVLSSGTVVCACVPSYPEVSVTGYDCSGAGALYPECIPTIPGRETDQLCRLAAETGMMLCVNPSAQVWCHECLRQQHDALDGLARRLPGLLERAPSGVVSSTLSSLHLTKS